MFVRKKKNKSGSTSVQIIDKSCGYPLGYDTYTIYKELERLLEKHRAGFSAKRAIELTHNMYQIKSEMPDSNEIQNFMLKMDSQQKALYEIVTK